ncbi:MAG: N-acetylmuramoyl-L-alanine amidase [candidate division KSB1 bacterium]|nr:N-acetylmuramoyl-L-alanine amidase [candidate division KSB1 bacterium]
MTNRHRHPRVLLFRLVLSVWLMAGISLSAKELTIATQNIQAQIPITLRDNASLISASELAQALDSPIRTQPQQASFKISYHTVQVYAHSPFVQIDNEFYQLPLKVQSRFDGYFLPYPFFCALFASLDSRIEFDQTTDRFILNQQNSTIQDLLIHSTDRSMQLIMKMSIELTKDDIRFEHTDRSIQCQIKGGIFSPEIDLQTIRHLFKHVEITHSEHETGTLFLEFSQNMVFDSLEVSPDNQLVLVFHEYEPEMEQTIFTELKKEREKWRIDTIIIDPGHGGRDPGAVGPGGLYEKNITLSIASEIRDILKQERDINVRLTRESNSFIPLKRRTEIANQTGGKLFISVHVDANPVHSLRGHTVYFMGPAKTEAARQAAQFENSVIKFENKQSHYDKLSNAAFILAANAQNSYNKESQDLADIIDHKITSICRSRSIGVRQAGFYVLYGTSMPNVLIETGFMTNPQDRSNLRNASYQKKLAQAISKGILEFKTKYENMTL